VEKRFSRRAPGALTDAPFLSEGHASSLGQYSQVGHQRPEMGTQKVSVEAYIMKFEAEEEYRFKKSCAEAGGESPQ
jgi:hypothetical protein